LGAELSIKVLLTLKAARIRATRYEGESFGVTNITERIGVNKSGRHDE